VVGPGGVMNLSDGRTLRYVPNRGWIDAYTVEF
jgi:hypothetical protein